MKRNCYTTPSDVPHELKESLSAIIDYLWEDELKHVREAAASSPQSCPEGHIVGHLARVREWLKGE